MDRRDAVIRRVIAVIDRLSRPLTVSDIAGGWSEESRAALLGFFKRLCDDLKGGTPAFHKPEYMSIARGMDTWGIIDGDILEEAASISNAIAAIVKMPE